jgi:hypothetical protein
MEGKTDRRARKRAVVSAGLGNFDMRAYVFPDDKQVREGFGSTRENKLSNNFESYERLLFLYYTNQLTMSDTPFDGTLKEPAAPVTSLRGKIDFFVNNILYGAWALSLLGVLLWANVGFEVLVLLLAIVVGLYQLLSGLVGWLAGNRRKGVYLLLALFALLLWVGWQYLTETGGSLPLGEKELGLFGFVALPFLLATYYTYLNYQVYHHNHGA